MGESLTRRLLCWRCERLLADKAGPGTSIRCPRCGARNCVPLDSVKVRG
jgi:DNA-directed RNA polymerase subunit RPC12/RpoP